MKEQISKNDQEQFGRLSIIFTVLFVATIITMVPLVHFLSWVGVGIWVALFGITWYAAILVERKKKKLNIQTYKEIVAFTEGKELTEIEKAREEGKRVYQKILYAVGAAAITFIIAIFFLWILG